MSFPSFVVPVPSFQILCGVPEALIPQQNGIVFAVLKRCEETTGVVATANVSTSTCMYAGKYAGTKPSMQIMLTFNAVRTTTDQTRTAAQYIINELAKSFNQHVVSAYEISGVPPLQSR